MPCYLNLFQIKNNQKHTKNAKHLRHIWNGIDYADTSSHSQRPLSSIDIEYINDTNDSIRNMN